MARYPRKELDNLPDGFIESEIAPLSWDAIWRRCEDLDQSTHGRISADATLILSLVLQIVDPRE